MRVTENLLYNQMSNDVNNASSSYSALEQELATGKQINEPSDNPAGTSESMTITSLLTQISQYQTDASGAESAMQNTSSVLNSAEELVTQARTIAVAAANGGTEDATQQTAYANQIQSIISQLVDLANTQYNGQYIFSGTATNTAPYTAGDSTFTYNGNDDAMVSTIGQNQTVQTNVTADEVFAPQFSALSQLQTDITNGDYSAISNTDLAAIDSGLSTLSNVQAQVGTTIDQVQRTASSLTTTQANYQTSLANLEDCDIATVYTQLQSAQNVYQASLVATADAMKYSLAQYI
jgi:flagellar hook-associated protein 3 FlgL